jgi:gliding motility-associated-like protein
MKLTMPMLPLLVMLPFMKAHIQPMNHHRPKAATMKFMPAKATNKWFSDTYNEQDGLVIMEMENTASDLDLWVKKTNMADYKGTGHLEFTGNKITNGPPTSPLEYKFKINTAGEYRLFLRAHKRLETDREDLSNDCFVRVAGDYTAGNETNDAPLDALRKDTKLFGGEKDAWGLAIKLDLPGGIKKDAIYTFKAGETYTLTISGRSKNFNIDRIMFFKRDQYTYGKARDAINANDESSYVDGGSNGGGSGGSGSGSGGSGSGGGSTDSTNTGGTGNPADVLSQVKAMNMITPNGDGNNDTWQVENLSLIDNYEVIVFNRAGQVVFRTTNYTIPWDGTRQGAPLPQGVYYYNLVLEHQGVKEKKSGFITLLR